jgi:hypothetical protein
MLPTKFCTGLLFYDEGYSVPYTMSNMEDIHLVYLKAIISICKLSICHARVITAVFLS